VQALEKQVDVPNDKIMVTVEDGWVRLQGSVEWEYQKKSVGAAVRNLKNVEGVFNNIEVKTSRDEEETNANRSGPGM
jgi:osmotically-inducible protein OsmY